MSGSARRKLQQRRKRPVSADAGQQGEQRRRRHPAPASTPAGSRRRSARCRAATSPTSSSGCASPRPAGSAGAATRTRTSAARPTGTLSQNTQRQDAYSDRNPPSSGPIGEEELADSGVDRHRHALLAPAGKAAITIAADTGSISAAPAPCAARAVRISGCPDEPCGTSPQPAEATKKTTTPTRNVLTRPMTSPSLPPKATSAAIARTYALTTHCSPLALSGRSRDIDGSATVTTVWSSVTIDSAPVIATRISQRLPPGALGRRHRAQPTGTSTVTTVPVAFGGDDLTVP